MTNGQIAEITVDAVRGLMQKLPTITDRREALGLLLMVAYNQLRILEGDEFVGGWLECALENLEKPPIQVSQIYSH